MKKLILLVLVLGLLFGCATIQPTFEKSNQLFIEKTVDNLDLGNAIRSKVPVSSKVALVSIEKEITLDKPIIALIEDQLIQSLVDNGYVVLERDNNAVENLIKEKDKSNYSSLYKKYEYFEHIDEIKVEISELDFEPVKLSETHLIPADYLISYRIQECGLIYQDKKNDVDYDIREGLIRLHVRVQKTDDGEIVFVKNLEGKKQDEIRKSLVSQLANFHYSHFPYEYPLQPKEKKGAVIKKRPTGKGFFYFAPTTGLGFGYESGQFAFGGTIGYGNPNFGRLGANFTGVIENETYNITLQYERPIEISKVFYLTPKLGAGYVSDSYKEKEDFLYYYDYEWHQTSSFGLVLGGALEFNITKPFLIKVGYDWFLGLGEKEATNGALQTTLGFRF